MLFDQFSEPESLVEFPHQDQAAVVLAISFLATLYPWLAAKSFHPELIPLAYRLSRVLSYRLLHDRLTEGFEIASCHSSLVTVLGISSNWTLRREPSSTRTD